MTETCTPTAGTPTIQMHQGDVNVFIFSRDVQLASDGHLSGTIVIPATHLISPLSPDVTVPVEPGDAFTVAATCDATGSDYFTAPEDFVVTEPTASTTTTAPATTSPSTTTSPTNPPTTSTTTAPAAEQPTVHTSQGSVAAGSAVTVAGDGFAPEATLDIELHSTPVQLGSTTSRADGTYSATVTIPSGTTTGGHSIVVSGRGIDGTVRQVTATITVTARAITPGTTTPGTTTPGHSARAASAVSSTPTFTG